MILLDYSAITIANISILIREEGLDDVAELPIDLLRHMILNSLKKYVKKYKEKYGKLILCMDAKGYWRTELFEHYKAIRKQKKLDDDTMDWNAIYNMLNEIRDEIITNMPYKTLLIEKSEADDIIGYLAKTKHKDESIMIVSNDKDFYQLQRYKNVKQYRPVLDKLHVEEEPLLYLKELIIRGQKKDDIPNILSVENSFVDKIRQKSVMKKKLTVWLEQEPEEFCDETQLKRYRKNEELIDLSFTPMEIQLKIEEEFNKSCNGRNKMLSYFASKNLKSCIDHINEF